MLTHKGTRDLLSHRLVLRRFLLSDAEPMLRNYAADERVTRFLGWTPYENSTAVESFLSPAISEYARCDVYHWAIQYRGEIVGSISVTQLDERNQSCEIGYCLGYAYWSQGITSEALRMVLGFLFLEVHMRKVIAKHDVENPASGEVMKKCGMICEGRLRKHYFRHDGTSSDALLYGMLREEFPGGSDNRGPVVGTEERMMTHES